MEETIVQDGLVSGGGATSSEDGWLRTGGVVEKEQTRLLDDVRTLDGSGNVNTDREEYEEAIPDMEDEEDDSEAIIRDPREAGAKAYVVTSDSLHGPLVTSHTKQSVQGTAELQRLHYLHALLPHAATLPLGLPLFL